MGCLKVVFDDDCVVGVSFEDAAEGGVFEECDVVREIKEFLDGTRRSFSFRWSMRGTPFQCRVWEELTKIPYGEVRSYGEIARVLGVPGASRAVGGACNRNPLLFVVPCHRVVGARGGLTGFAAGVDRKAFLLEMEGKAK